MITNEEEKEKGFQETVPEPNIATKPSVTSEHALLFKSFVGASSESENFTEEFSGVSKNFCAKLSFVESFAAAATDFAYSVGNLAENLGQGILIREYEEAVERAGSKGHVAQWKEPLFDARGDAGSNSVRKTRRAHTNLHAHSTNPSEYDGEKVYEKEENQARSLEEALVRRTRISHEFFSGSENHEPHTLKQFREDEVFKTFAFSGTTDYYAEK